MTAVRRLITLLLMSLAAGSLLAQTETPVTRQTEAVAAETDRDLTDPRALRLTRDEAVRNTITRNLGIDILRFDTRISGEEIRRQYGIFDPLLSGALSRSSRESASLSDLDSGASRETLLTAQIRQFLPTGGTYSVGVVNSRETASGPFVNFSPGYSADLALAFDQPLLRNFGLDVNRRGINIARNNLGISREAFRDTLRRTALLVDLAYYDLAYFRRNVEVVKESLFLARDQARITRIRIDVGASAPLDILQPNVQIAQTEELLIRAVANVRDAEDRLRRLMNLPPEDWDRPIVPTDDVAFRPLGTNLDQAVATAYERRPEIRQEELQAENLRIQYLYARNQRLPQLDLNVDYGLAGVGGRVIGDPTIPETDFTDALQNVFNRDFPRWTVGVTVGVPLTNIGARAAARQAELDLEQQLLSQADTRQGILIEVRTAVRDVETGARAIVAARTAREAAERNVEAERRRYENGMTTNFQVLQIQQQLSDARRTELLAIIGYNQAVSRYEAAVGTILETHNIATEEIQVAEEPDMFRFEFLDRFGFLNYGSRVRDNEETKK
jgi:outer membrane protein